MAGTKNKRLPSFGSVDEFVAFFESHDMGDYWDQLPRAEIEVSLTKVVRARNSSLNKVRSNLSPGQLHKLSNCAN